MLKQLINKLLGRRSSQFLGRPSSLKKSLLFDSRFSESHFQNDTGFCKTDAIANDPFFSRVEETINNVGLEKASEMLGREVISIYFKLFRNRLERQLKR